MKRRYHFDWWAKFFWPTVFWLTTVSLYLACLHLRAGNWWFAASAVLSAIIFRFAVKSVGEWEERLVSRGISNGRYIYSAGSYRQTRIVQASDGEDIFFAIIWWAVSFFMFWSLGGGR